MLASKAKIFDVLYAFTLQIRRKNNEGRWKAAFVYLNRRCDGG
jgi:hypothetical protein